MEIPERSRHLLDRTGLVEVGRLPVRAAVMAVVGALPTFAEARRFFDIVRDKLGERAVVEEERGPQRWIYLRDADDPSWLLAPPLVEEQGWGPVGDVPETPRDRIVPKGPDMHAGKLLLAIDGARYELEYDADGMKVRGDGAGGDNFVNMFQSRERPFVVDPSARPPTPPPFPLFVHPSLDEAGHTLDQIADMLIELALASDPPVRLRAPDPLPLGSERMLLRIHASVAAHLWHTGVAADDRWLCVDGLCGRAITSGPTRASAISPFAKAVWRNKPGLLGTAHGESLPFEVPKHLLARTPRDRTDDPIPLPNAQLPEGATKIPVFEGTISIGPFQSAHEWPAPDPERMPCALVRIPVAPVVPARLVEAGFVPLAITCDKGRIAWTLRRDDADGWTFVGPGIADLVDPRELDAELDAAEAAWQQEWGALMPDWNDPPRPVVTHWSVWDCERQRRASPRQSGAAAGSFHPVQLDARAAPWQVVRVRY